MKGRSRGRLPGDDEADRPSWGWNDLPLPVIVLLAAVLVALLISLGELLEPPTATSPATPTDSAVQVSMPSARPAPTLAPPPTPTPSVTPSPTALPGGYRVLVLEVENASFGLHPDPARPETALRLAAGTRLIFDGEQMQGRCRVRLLDDDDQAGNDPQVWLDCATVGV